MKVYSYNSEVARRARPSMRHPLRRLFYVERRGAKQSFLMSSKKRLYILRGEGVADLPAIEQENLAFEKYAPLRGFELLMLARVHSCVLDSRVNLLTADCDLLDYHEHVMRRHQRVEIPKAYKNTKLLWRYIKDFDNEMVDESKLQLNEAKTKIFEAKEFGQLKSALMTSVCLNVPCVVLALFWMRLFFFAGLAFGLQAILRFRRILKSPYATDKKSAYVMVVNLILMLVAFIGIATAIA